MTCNTYAGKPIFRGNEHLLLEMFFQRIPREHVIAWVISDSQFHALVNPESNDLAELMRAFRAAFSSEYRKRSSKPCGRVWQQGCLTHVVKSQNAFNNCIDFIHYDPVKHGLVRNPKDWQFSSFRTYLTAGLYPENWGVNEPPEFRGNSFSE